MTQGKLTVGQIGCGAFAHARHLPNVTSRPDLVLKYCCDTRIESARAVTDYMGPIDDPEVDILMAATPHDMHLPIIRAAAGGNLKLAVNAIPADKGHKAMSDGFAEAVRNDTPAPCDEYAGLQATLPAGLTMRTIRTKQTVPVPVEELRPAIF